MTANVILMREVIVTSTSNGDSGTLPFDPAEVTDSEALHFLLCQLYPSEEYTVTFRNISE
jgi:hypothetical protein